MGVVCCTVTRRAGGVLPVVYDEQKEYAANTVNKSSAPKEASPQKVTDVWRG